MTNTLQHVYQTIHHLNFSFYGLYDCFAVLKQGIMKTIKMFWWYCLILGFVVTPSKLFSQTTPETAVKIKGIVVNSADNKALSGSVIVLKSETEKYCIPLPHLQTVHFLLRFPNT
jgi:hypothetical protein